MLYGIEASSLYRWVPVPNVDGLRRDSVHSASTFFVCHTKDWPHPPVTCDGFGFGIVGRPICILFLLCGVQLVYSRMRCFFDRYSISQNKSDLTPIGLHRLPLYIEHSRAMYCFFDEKYLTRMWCMVEVALYMSRCEKPKIYFLSIAQKKAGVVTVFIVLLTNFIYSTAKYLNDSENDPHSKSEWDFYLSLTEIFLGVTIRAVLFYFARHLFHSLDKLRDAQRNFDVRNCELSFEQDRPLLLKVINEGFSIQPKALNRTSVGSSEFPNNSAASEENVAKPDETKNKTRRRQPSRFELVQRVRQVKFAVVHPLARSEKLLCFELYARSFARGVELNKSHRCG